MTRPLFLLCLLAVPLTAQQPATLRLSGAWTGAATRQGAVLPLHAEFVHEGRALRIDAPSMGLFGRISGIRRQEGRLDIAMGTFSLHMEPQAKRGVWRGKLGRRGVNGPFGEVELLSVARPATPPVRYEQLRFKSADGTELGASIILPAGPGPHPAVVYVQGRSYGSRFNHHSHAVGGARRGIAGLIFDGRGVGQSGGTRGKHTRQQRLDDAAAAYEALTGHGEIAKGKVGLFGHSAGGWVVPVVAQMVEDPAFVILHAGPAGTLADQQAQVVREMLRRSGNTSKADGEALFAYQHRLVELVVSGANWPQIAAHVVSAKGKPWAERGDRPKSLDDPELDYFRRNPHDNVAALKQTQIPLLAMYGEDDYIVPPPDNVRQLETYMRAAGNERHRIVVFEGANHALMLPESRRGAKDYRFPQRPPGFDDLLYSWILAQVKPKQKAGMGR